MTEREPSFGEKACGVSFNPSNDPTVDMLKREYATIVDLLYNLKMQAAAVNAHETVRMLSVAITDTQTAQMWAVKAVTWKY